MSELALTRFPRDTIEMFMCRERHADGLTHPNDTSQAAESEVVARAISAFVPDTADAGWESVRALDPERVTVSGVAAALRHLAPSRLRYPEEFEISRPSTGSSSVICAMPPVSGVPACYYRLSSAVAHAHALVGYFDPGSVAGSEPIDTVPGKAAHHVRSVAARLDSGGRVVLTGWSIGGLIAYELAHQLLASGHRVSALVLIDTVPPALLTDLGDDDLHTALPPTQPDLAEGVEGRLEDRVEQAIQRAMAGGRVVEGVQSLELHRRMAVRMAGVTAAKTYWPTTRLDVPAHYILSERDDQDVLQLKESEWSDLLATPPTVIRVPGGHDGALYFPALLQVGEVFTDLMASL